MCKSFTLVQIPWNSNTCLLGSNHSRSHRIMQRSSRWSYKRKGQRSQTPYRPGAAGALRLPVLYLLWAVVLKCSSSFDIFRYSNSKLYAFQVQKVTVPRTSTYMVIKRRPVGMSNPFEVRGVDTKAENRSQRAESFLVKQMEKTDCTSQKVQV